jgi:phosphoribosyl-ATP pyrophosphohydrolase/phosphoribosyl-AMP cyclohydrolase/histidinol dehydrogenase
LLQPLQQAAQRLKACSCENSHLAMLYPIVSLSDTSPEELGERVASFGVCGPVYVKLSAEWFTYVGKVASDPAASAADDSKARVTELKASAGKWAKDSCRQVDTIVGPFPASQRALAGVLLDSGILRIACPVSSAEDVSDLATLAAEVPAERLGAIVTASSASTEDVVDAISALGRELLGSLGAVYLQIAGDAASGATLVGLVPDGGGAAYKSADRAAAAPAAAPSTERGTALSVAGVKAARAACKPAALALLEVETDEAGAAWAHRAHLDVIAAAQIEPSAANAASASAAAASASASASGLCSIGTTLAMCARSDRRDGLVTTVVSDELGVCLGLVYSSAESIEAAIQGRRGIYWSRSRGGLWRKGDSSGMIQTLVRARLDCDSDALLFNVRQAGDPPSFCHLLTRTCWGGDRSIGALQRVLESRLVSAPTGSYTKRLFDDEELLRAKLLEEAQELSEAKDRDHAAAETADVIYFALVAAVSKGASLEDVQDHLHWRSRKVQRRPGNAKPERIQAAADFFAAKSKAAGQH